MTLRRSAREPVAGAAPPARTVALARGAIAWLALACALAATVATTAGAHPTITFGELNTDPSPPVAGQPVEVRFTLYDPVDAPVEQAIVHLEATYRPPDAAPTERSTPEADADETSESLPPGGRIVTDPFDEVAPATYRTTVTFPYDGDWTLWLRDRTYRQEETDARITLRVGPNGTDAPISFLFPPTAVGPQSLTTWLIWLIGLPLLAGAVVTVLVLRSSDAGNEPTEPDATSGEPSADDRRA
ncbi:MAG: hypothetical protein WD336_01470 [Trueperaceae bacterium]